MSSVRNIVVAVFVVACVTALSWAQDAPEEFAAVVSGTYVGKGKLNVSGGTIEMEVSVTNNAGHQGKLIVHLPVKENRFSGGGSVAGKPIQITGRIDPTDKSGPLKSYRVLAMFKSTAGDVGRVVGYVKIGGAGDE